MPGCDLMKIALACESDGQFDCSLACSTLKMLKSFSCWSNRPPPHL